MIQAILILLAFLVCVILMVKRKMNTLVGLPLLAFSIAIIGRIPAADLATQVISEGAFRLHQPMILIILGATLAELVKASGLIDWVIRATAEYGGDRPALMTLGLVAVVSVLFTVLSGLGAVVMVGSIALPILLSAGLAPVTAAGVLLLALTAGGLFNLVNWSLFIEVLGLSTQQILHFLGYFAPMFVVVMIVYIFFALRHSAGSSFKNPESPALPPSPGALVLLIPLVPVALMMGFTLRALLATDGDKPFQLPIATAMICGIVYATCVIPSARGTRLKILTQSCFEGIRNVAPALVLMIGIGMLLKAVSHPMVSQVLSPIVGAAVPTGRWGYIAFFGLLTPLALYRGPLNLWGMGSGLVLLVRDHSGLAPEAIMAALLSVGLVQGACDPTNTHNVWIGNHVGVDGIQILRSTLPWMWAASLLGLGIAAFVLL